MARDESTDIETPPEDGGRAAPFAPVDGMVVLSVDAMSGDLGPAPVLDGLSAALAADPALRFLIHGRADALEPLLGARPALRAAATLRPCPDVVDMAAKPVDALRQGRESSMWGSLDALADGEAQVALSPGNTGALMTMAMVRLRPAPGVGRTAIAALWPSRSPAGRNVVLDMGADVRADAGNLVDYAVMGAEYARLSLGVARPRVALLNIGVEDSKGRGAVVEAAGTLRTLDPAVSGFDFVGFVEGGDIPGRGADVVVTDGFTGNVALKTAEGTARLVGDYLREALEGGLLSRLAALLAAGPLSRLKRRIDPRRVNGGVFLGLNGVVVKSHGAADAVGVSAAVELAAQLGRAHIAQRIAGQVAKLSRD